MVGQVLPRSRKGPVAGFGWTCWNTNILISWISTMRTKMICVRPQWLGFWKQFYRQEDLTCHLHTRNPLQSLTHAQANWSGTSWLTYRQTYHRTYRSSECWMLPLVHMHTLAVNFDIFICGRKYTYSATNRGCFFNGTCNYSFPLLRVILYLYCIVVGSRMPPDALHPKAYCTNPGR